MIQDSTVMTTSIPVTPFRLATSDTALQDLRARLERTRLPDRPAGHGWEVGTDLDWFQGLLGRWRDGFDWRAQEAQLNAWPQFLAQVGDTQVHFLHAQGSGPAPLPLLLVHGWPGSVFEFLDLIPRLTRPQDFGGRAEDAFTVVVPSLPGYGLSYAPGRRFGVEQMSEVLAALMAGLGYRRYGTQGGDWGASVTARIACLHPERVVGVHLNFLPLSRDTGGIRHPDAAEQAYVADVAEWLRERAAYAAIQGTRPQTLAYALMDSPAGLAAWIAEKFQAWSDCGGEVERAIDLDRLLANICLYWFSGSIASSFWPYYARAHGAAWPVPEEPGVRVPMGYAEFPREILKPPRSIAVRTFRDIRRWQRMPRGGHFAAMEQPDLLAFEIKEFFRPLRRDALA
jgi:microsomal epoxide hydrolase